MKLLSTLVLVASLILSASVAHAQLNYPNFKRIYKNAAGDRFEISMDKDTFTFKDLQLGYVYHAETGHYTLQRQPTQTARLVGSLGGVAPVSLALEEARAIDARTLFMRIQLPSKMDQINSGLVSPVIEVKISLYYYYPEYFGIYVDSVKAVENANDSFAQKAFIKGINLALGLVFKYGRSTVQEYLTLQ